MALRLSWYAIGHFSRIYAFELTKRSELKFIAC